MTDILHQQFIFQTMEQDLMADMRRKFINFLFLKIFYTQKEIYFSNVNNSWTYKGQNMSSYLFNATDIDISSTGRYIGYTSLTFLNIRQSGNVSLYFWLNFINNRICDLLFLKLFSQPWSNYQPQNNVPSIFPAYQTSIFDTKSNRIFFFGGAYLNLTTSTFVDIPFNNAMVFDMTNGNWTTQPSGGQKIPTSRTGHTTTLRKIVF